MCCCCKEVSLSSNNEKEYENIAAKLHDIDLGTLQMRTEAFEKDQSEKWDLRILPGYRPQEDEIKRKRCSSLGRNPNEEKLHEDWRAGRVKRRKMMKSNSID